MRKVWRRPALDIFYYTSHWLHASDVGSSAQPIWSAPPRIPISSYIGGLYVWKTAVSYSLTWEFGLEYFHRCILFMELARLYEFFHFPIYRLLFLSFVLPLGTWLFVSTHTITLTWKSPPSCQPSVIKLIITLYAPYHPIRSSLIHKKPPTIPKEWIIQWRVEEKN